MAKTIKTPSASDFTNAKNAASKLFPQGPQAPSGGANRGVPSRITTPQQASRNTSTMFPDALQQGVAPIRPLPFVLSTTKNLGENQVEVITATGGTRTLTFDGQTTGAIAYDASAATIKTALEALSNVATDDIIVQQSISSPFTYTFGAAYAGTDVPVITSKTYFLDGETSTFTTVTTGANEVQRETVTATGGTRTLTFNGQVTSALAYNASNTTIQTALEALSNVDPGDITVTGTGPYTYTFGGQYKGIDVPLIVVGTGSLTGGSSTMANITTGAEEFQVETINATSGYRTLTFDGQTTAAIAYNATAADIQAALVALSNVAPGDITVKGTYVNSYTFQGAFKNTDVPTLVVNAGSLTGGTATITKTSQSMEEIISRGLTQDALSANGLRRGAGQIANDVEVFNQRKPKDIGDPLRIPGEDFGLR
jgi:glycine cleavage system regulatory protein